MAASIATSEEDPLTAALPPTTDYITYLTILEYRLTPHNLSTLNGILDRDDGTLAKEIGWDLLRLVLPMLPEVPSDANQCLDQIARRGNPREVVVRVAEELEKLGRIEDNSDDGDEVSDSDGLPTFEGEATRIHLGQMKLDGMPDAEQQTLQDDGKKSIDHQPAASDAALEALQLPALLSVLSTVHPRIKTQYPSRFLATSLPAALAAYRRMPITEGTTHAFLQCLEKLGGKSRPALPPRQSTTDAASIQPTTASLPDPEAPEEAAKGTNVASQLEQTIISRLLQAVLLEVLDEYSTSWQSSDVPSMLWTTRLRERHGEAKIAGKITATQLSEVAPLRERGALLQHFLSLSKTLGLDLHEGLKGANSNAVDEHPEEPTEEPSEYPTSPSQIPLSRTACLLLLAAEGFSKFDSVSALAFSDVSRMVRFFTPLSDMPNIPNSSVQDALNSLLYNGIATSPPEFIDGADSSTYIELLSILTQTFTISPDPTSRDDAHYIAQSLFHKRSSVDDRISIVKQTIRCTTQPQEGLPAVPLATPFTEGALRAVGVDWLKDSILASLAANPSENTTIGIDPARLQSDRSLDELIWHPSIPTPTDTRLLSTVLMTLPYYTALLNLSNVLINRLSLKQYPFVLENVRGLLQNLDPWRDHLVEQLGTNEEAKASGPEIYAFEDAVLRVRDATAVKEKQQEKSGMTG
jgi:hypothetical protein